MNRIFDLFHKYRDLLSYLFFGALTTAVNFVVYTPLHRMLGMSAAGSNVIAWAVSVLFAFVTNKAFVFQSKSWTSNVLWPELWKFTACRVASGLMETGWLALTVDLLGFHGLTMKVIASILVIIANYIGSKLLVFRK